jgi:hypothetical protein
MDLREIYLCYDIMEADRIKGLLEENGIYCIFRDMTITPYPMNIGRFAEKRIVVEEDKVEEAICLIEDAIRDGFISSDGRFKDRVA